MINYETILSTFDDKLTLLQWLQKVEEALQGAGLERVDITQVTPTTAVFKFTFADGTSLTTPSITLPRGPKGDTGATGATGNGIASITKTGTSGLIDTYTVLYTNGSTDTFTVTNGADGAEGNGIASIEKTSTVGLVDTYTVTYTDGDTMTFTVTNGANGTMEVIDIGTVTTSGQTIALTKAQYDKLTASGVTCLVKLYYLNNYYYLTRDYEGGGFYHYTGNIVGVSGGYNSFTATIYQSGSDYEAQFTIANSIIANPTLAGTETALSGLQVNGTKYKVGGGGELNEYTFTLTSGATQADFQLLNKIIRTAKGKITFYSSQYTGAPALFNYKIDNTNNPVDFSIIQIGTYVRFIHCTIYQNGNVYNTSGKQIDTNNDITTLTVTTSLFAGTLYYYNDTEITA